MIKFALAKEHRLYFEKNQMLEVEGVLTPLQIQQLKFAIERSVAQAAFLNESLKKLPAAAKPFMAGRDLWRNDNLIKKIVFDRDLAKIAADLMGVRFLRLGYDQYFPNPAQGSGLTLQNSSPSPYEEFLKVPATLEEISCIQGMECGLMICLGSNEQSADQPSPLESPFALKAGNIVYFSAQKVIDFSQLLNRSGQDFLMIGYAAKTALYFTNESDPHFHALKPLGYVFGDRLNDQIHPVVYRD